MTEGPTIDKRQIEMEEGSECVTRHVEADKDTAAEGKVSRSVGRTDGRMDGYFHPFFC